MSITCADGLPSVESIEVDGDKVRVTLSNGCTVTITVAEAHAISTDPQAARRFLQRWASPKGHR